MRTRTRRFGAALLFAACFGTRAVSAVPAFEPPSAAVLDAKQIAAQAAAASAELYLEVSLNGEKTGLVVPFRQSAAGLVCGVDSLRELGLDPALFGVAGRQEFTLDAVAGLTYAYDAAAQSIDLRLGDALRQPFQLQARSTRAAGPGHADPGVLLNYDLYAQLGGAGRVAALNEVRVFGPLGVFSNSGAAILRGQGQRYTRYDTSWTWSDPASLQTVQVGDVVTPALNWTRSLRMGGIEWRRNFDLRPDQLTYPLAAIGGSAVVPSDVSLYVNGVQQFNAEVPGGPFMVDQVAGLNGAGQATIVTRDALGRSVAKSIPLYVDTRLLAPGLSDFAFSLGALRRDYGMRSLRYAKSPAATASGRYGWSDALTLEGHFEAGRGLANGGAGALLRLGKAGGVLSGALAVSAIDRASGNGVARRGMQANLGYQYIAPRVALDLQSTRASGGYADLGTLEGAPVSRASDRATLSVSLEKAGSLSASFVHYRAPAQAAVRLASLAYSRSLWQGAFFSLSGYQDLDRKASRGLTASLSIPLGERISLSAGGGLQGGDRSRSLTVSSAPDYTGGWGWGVQNTRSGALDVSQAQVQYLGSAGQLVASTVRAGTSHSSAVGLSGSLVALDGTVAAARQVGRGFALVETGLAGVPVSHENRPIGRTGKDGRLLVTDLVPYTANLIAIDATDLPVDTRLESTSLQVVPQAGAGVVAAFKVERYRAATVIVHGLDGKPLAAGTPVRQAGGTGSLVGYDGVVFLDNLQEQNEIVLGQGVAACTLRFAYQPGAGGELPVIGPLRCMPHKDTP